MPTRKTTTKTTSPLREECWPYGATLGIPLDPAMFENSYRKRKKRAFRTSGFWIDCWGRKPPPGANAGWRAASGKLVLSRIKPWRDSTGS